MATVLRAHGEIDVVTAPHLHDSLDEHKGPIVLDLSDVTFMDASGVRVIIQALQNKEITIVRARPNIQKLLSICGLDNLVTP